MVNSLNFGGFYGSIHEGYIDDMVENFFSDKDGNVKPDSWEQVDYKKLHKAYCVEFLDNLSEYILDDYEIEISLNFKYLESPKFYNYTTDKILYSVNKRDYKRLYNKIKDNEDFIEHIKNCTTSTDGYIAFYSFEDYQKSFDLWDDTQTGIVLDFICDLFMDDDYIGYFDRNNITEIIFHEDFLSVA